MPDRRNGQSKFFAVKHTVIYQQAAFNVESSLLF